MHESTERLALKGTTTVCVVCSDGVILSSDTRVTMGNFVAHKLHNDARPSNNAVPPDRAPIQKSAVELKILAIVVA